MMCLSFVVFYVAVFTTFAPLQANAARVDTSSCDRSASREASKVINRVILPLVTKFDYKLPPACPLDAKKGIFARQEAHKEEIRTNVWKCMFDGKVFRGESYVDKHMEKNYANEVDPGANFCLADYCSMLSCDFFEYAGKGKLSQLRRVPCHKKTAHINRRKCQELAYDCFPPSRGRKAEHLLDVMLSQICEANTCKWSRRVALLTPLATDSHKKTYVRWAVFIMIVAVLVMMYAAITIFWRNKTAMDDNSILKLMERFGFTKQQHKMF